MFQCLDDLKQSKDDNETKLKKVIISWKDTKSSPLTWETVITALENPIVNKKEIADRICHRLKICKLLLLSNEVVY